MSVSFYQILEANEVASFETLQALFEQKRDRLKKELEEGSPFAKEQLWALKHAYQTLSNPAKRAIYDDSLKIKVIQSISNFKARPEGLSWKMNAL